MKIIADSAIPFLRGVLELYAQVTYIEGSLIGAADLRDADALVVRTRTHCTKALLAGSTVQMIATATIGFDHIDIDYCTTHGIRVATAAGCNARGVLQWIGAVFAYLSKKQGWRPSEKTVGVVGVGHVGSLVSEYAAAWGFRVLCCDPPREEHEHLGFMALEEVAAEVDILTFHTPLDSSTLHMGNRMLFAKMKPHAVVVNASRGAVVDGKALLESGLGCVLDVWEHEPHIDRTLLERTLLATPHIAGYSLQGKANATAQSVRSLSKHFGFPLQDWYPEGVPPSRPLPMKWQELGTTIAGHFDIAAQNAALKARPEEFESMRDNYRHREEYF